MRFFLGIEIGGTKLQLVTGTGDGAIIARETLAIARAGGAESIRTQIAKAVEVLRPGFQWSAIGVGYGGPINWKTGVICRSHHVGGWDGFPLAEWLRGVTGLPVAVENDTNAAALGEASVGAGMGFDPVFYTNSGSGVGGGLVFGGSIYHGAEPGEAELGHVRLDRAGATVEDRCSGWAVDRKVRENIATHPECLLARAAQFMTGGEARALGPALEAGCPVARAILAETAGDLAFGLSHVVHLFHPAIVILGGGLALIGEPWRTAVAAALPRYIMEAFAPGPDVRLSALGGDVVPVGALMLARKAASI